VRENEQNGDIEMEVEEEQIRPESLFFGGMPLTGLSKLAKLTQEAEEIQEAQIQESHELRTDQETLTKMLNIRSFKEIQKALNKRPDKYLKRSETSQMTLNGDENLAQNPICVHSETLNTCEKNCKTPISAFDEPLNLSHHYSQMNKTPVEVPSCIEDLEIEEAPPMPFWSFKMKSERMILQDIFLMYKGLQSDTFTKL
jgi:hypothetical protein